jgi:methylenetetrahydrofolate dehydrogenase (NADP+)/methenyltetrahydrofolate cyclohydrolase
MPAQLIDGNALAKEYREDIARRVQAVKARRGSVRLDALLASSGDTAARMYAVKQGETCAALGIHYELHEFGPSGTGFQPVSDSHGPGASPAQPSPLLDAITTRVRSLNSHTDVTAIMLHLPLPPGIDAYQVQRLIAPEKDVEGVNPVNIGNIVYGQSSLVPCTALAVLKMIQHTGCELRGQRAVVVGASDVVGKPIAVLLMREDATVASCNKYTWGLADLSRSADILVAAAGVPHLITAEMVKPGAVVIDVGVNRIADPANPGKKKTVGDVEERARNVAAWLSPVPGGVGPVTVAMLLENVIQAAERAAGIPT